MDAVAKLDTEWAIKEIDKILTLTDQIPYDNTGRRTVVLGTHARGSETEISQQKYVVEKILDQVLPGWARESPKQDQNYDWLRDQASRAKSALERSAELAENLGDNAPDMDASNLHPWAWERGKSLWNTGHHHEAVMQAAILVNAETQSKLARMDVSEVALFNEAFSLDPPKPGAPRLRLMENDASKTYQNLHRGARTFADGLYTAIRNPGMHTPSPTDGGEEQLALEQLAAFSLLARWIDQARVEK